MLRTEQTVVYLLNNYSSTIILWTLIITMFLKVVFSKVDGFLKMTINFPISSKERNVSIFLYETLLSLFIIALVSFSVVLSIILIYQLAFIDLLVVNILYVSTFTYLILQLISKLTSFVCHITRIPKLFHIINISILALIFGILFREAQELVTKLADDFLNETNNTQSILLFWQNVHIDYGFIITTFIYFITVVILIGLIFLIPDNSYMTNTKHIKIVKFKKNTLIKTYIFSSVRNVNTLNTVALVYLTSLILIVFNLKNFIVYSNILLAMNGIYSYVHSQNVRQIIYKFNYKAWKDYLYLLISQIIIVYIISVPILLLGIFVMDQFVHLIYPYLITTLGILIFVLAGILFPPYNDNPFSVVTSILVVTVPILTLSISLAFLNLGLLMNSLLIFFFYIVIILFSVHGLINLKRSFRHEKDSFIH